MIGVAGNGSLKTTEHSETEFLGDPGTVNECRVIRHLGGAVDLPGTTQASAAGLGLQLNSNGTYGLDFGGFGSAILASGPAAVRSYDFYRKAPSEDRACASWLLGGIDATTTQNRSVGMLATDAPEMAGRVQQGELAGTASRVIDLAFPEQGQGGSRTVTVTWSLRPK